MSLILTLWSAALLAAVVIVATDVRRGLSTRGADPAVIILAVDALLLIVAGLGTRYGLQLAEEMPRLYQALQGILPPLLCVLGGWLAARWFVTGGDAQTRSVWHSLAGTSALLLVLALVLVSDGQTGIVMDSAAVLILLLCGQIAQKLGERVLRRLRLAAALALFWASSFLVYLMIFPARVAVETGAEEGTAAAASGESFLWVAPLAFLAAFLLGFFKRQRG